MEKIVNFAERGARRNDPRSCFESLPEKVRSSVLALVGLENRQGVNQLEGEVSEQLIKSIGFMQTQMMRTAAELNIPYQQVEYAASWARGRPASEIRVSGSSPLVS
jgi:hypothetical protein